MTNEETPFAQLRGGGWRRAGTIETGGFEYQVDASSMRLGDKEAVSYAIREGFLRLTEVSLVDNASHRNFLLRQKRIWSGRLILLERDETIVEFTPAGLHSRYEAAMRGSAPESVVLLSLWLAMIGLVFTA